MAERSKSQLFQPLEIGNGKINLRHRIVHGPMVRSRGEPLNPTSTLETPNRIWYPGDLMVQYYSQRATEGGLIISEGTPISLESSGMPGACGIFHPKQIEGWKTVVRAVHDKGGYIYCQLWHAGRATIPQMTGSPTVSSSATPWDDPDECYHHVPVGYTSQVKYADHPPVELSMEGIKNVIREYCTAAQTAMEAGFDGVEVTSANGYILEQFLCTNVNKRTDEYGGSIENRCRIVLELMDALAKTVGEDNLAIRLSPFGLFNQNRSEQRLETWLYLSEMLKRNLNLSYVCFLEPHFEHFTPPSYKAEVLRSWGLEGITLASFRAIFGSTPFFSSGGWDDTNSWGVIEEGKCDALVYAMTFASNPDLVQRLKRGIELMACDGSRLFGPFEDNGAGYVDYPAAG